MSLTDFELKEAIEHKANGDLAKAINAIDKAYAKKRKEVKKRYYASFQKKSKRLGKSNFYWLDKETDKILDEFWPKFKAEPSVNPLREYSYRIIQRISDKDLRARRKEFNADATHRLLIGKPCVCCGEEADSRHHIIELQYGGSNSPKNIVPICSKCHSKVHPWLKNV